MTSDVPPAKPPAPPTDAEARLAAALRTNLRRRKQASAGKAPTKE